MLVVRCYPLGVVLRAGGYSPPPSGGRRGRIAGFSPRSRRRLGEFLVSVDWGKLMKERWVYWASFTYQADLYRERVLMEPRFFKEDLGRLGKYLDRRVGIDCAVWKMEWTKRGVPHFHLLLATECRSLRSVRRAAKEAWLAAVFPRGREHWARERMEKVAPNVKRVGREGGLVKYLTKYVWKAESGQPDVWCGRFWGRWGDWAPYQRCTNLSLPRREYCELRRLLGQWERAEMRRKGKRWKRRFWGLRGGFWMVEEELVGRLVAALPSILSGKVGVDSS